MVVIVIIKDSSKEFQLVNEIFTNQKKNKLVSYQRQRIATSQQHYYGFDENY
jgi:hypothetical protein